MLLRNALLCLGVMSFSLQVLGQSSKYDRKTKKSEPVVENPTAPGKASSSAEAKSPSPTEKKSEKVDISEMENRYWAPKDTEFSVVQNRLYTKAKRFSVAPTFGPLLNDAYNNSLHYGLVGNYYFSEREGVELQYFQTSAINSDLVSAFQSRNGITPNFNRPQWYLGAGYNWVPIYAKLSLLEKKILYFDMFLTPGLGLTNLKANRYQSNATTGGVDTVDGTSQTAVTVALDVGQQVFINENWALRVDLRNHWYSEKIYEANTGTVQREKITYSGAATFGLTYFFK